MSLLSLLLAHVAFSVLAARPGVASSRRLLAGAACLLVPVAGVAMAAIIRRARGGRGERAPEIGARSVRAFNPDDVRRLSEAPAVLDRLVSDDAGERLAALVALSKAADRESIRMLRWAIEHGTPEVVLDAALTLEELDLQRERALEQASARMAAAPSVPAAIAVGDAAAAGVLNGLADPIAVPALAEQARTAYLYARAGTSTGDGGASDLEERLARLELCAGRPHEALELVAQLERAAAPVDVDRTALERLRDAAAFAARRFELVGGAPAVDELRDHPAFGRLEDVLARTRAVRRRAREASPGRRTFEDARMAVKVATGAWRLDEVVAR